MPSDTWLKLHTSLLTSAKFCSLPSNEHRWAFVCLLLLAKKGLESAPESLTLGHLFMGKKRWKTVKKDLMDAGLLDASGSVNGFEDSQLSFNALRQRRYKERHRDVIASVTGNAKKVTDAEADADSSSSSPKKKKKEDGGATPEPVASPAYCLMPVKEGEEPITEADVAHWESLYGRIDVRHTLLKIVGYWSALPRNKRKTRTGIRKSINTWLAKDDDKAPVGSLPSRDNLVYERDPWKNA